MGPWHFIHRITYLHFCKRNCTISDISCEIFSSDSWLISYPHSTIHNLSHHINPCVNLDTWCDILKLLNVEWVNYLNQSTQPTSYVIFNMNCLVVYLPLWKISVGQLGFLFHTIPNVWKNNEKQTKTNQNKPDLSWSKTNHQPDLSWSMNFIHLYSHQVRHSAGLPIEDSRSHLSSHRAAGRQHGQPLGEMVTWDFRPNLWETWRVVGDVHIVCIYSYIYIYIYK